MSDVEINVKYINLISKKDEEKFYKKLEIEKNVN